MQVYNKTFPNIFFEQKKGKKTFFTKSLFPRNPVYGERLISQRGEEFRSWSHERSKLCAALQKGVSQIGIKEGDTVLYLGAANGTTPSHISDIVGREGFVFCVEFSPRSTRDLVFVCEKRTNMTPVLANANDPVSYSDRVTGADIVYMDIAQRNQTEIFLKNIKAYLKKDGFGLLFLKSRSVDVSKNPKEIYKQVRNELEREVTIVDYKELDPFEKDHALFIVKKR